jgi:hypothetical protein
VNRSRFLRVLGMDPKRWCDRFGIAPFSQPCDSCGRTMTTSIPFACGTLRGLLAPACVCGNQYPPYCIVRAPGHGDLLTGGM